jgi:hypothetical protein
MILNQSVQLHKISKRILERVQKAINLFVFGVQKLVRTAVFVMRSDKKLPYISIEKTYKANGCINKMTITINVHEAHLHGLERSLSDLTIVEKGKVKIPIFVSEDIIVFTQKHGNGYNVLNTKRTVVQQKDITVWIEDTEDGLF